MYYDERENYFNTEVEFENEINFYNSNFINSNEIIKENNKNNNIESLEKGFYKGSIFTNIYEPYKNYYFELKPCSEFEEINLKLKMLSFAINDLNLYLDLYPTDKELLNIFNNYSCEFKQLEKLYNEKYSSLSIDGKKYVDNFDYTKSPWPWEKGGNLNG